LGLDSSAVNIQASDYISLRVNVQGASPLESYFSAVCLNSHREDRIKYIHKRTLDCIVFERQLNGMIRTQQPWVPTVVKHRIAPWRGSLLQIDLQSNVLGFVNSFWILGLLVLLLIPLPFIMRRPSREEANASAAAH
jgi:hypothetical protein